VSEHDAIVRGRLRAVPKVDVLARHALLETMRLRYGEGGLVRAARTVVARVRQDILEGGEAPSLEDAARAVLRMLREAELARLRRVINGTGVLLHTNLGRAPLSSEAAARAAEVGRGYDALELDLATGGRGARGGAVERALSTLTGAEAALVVNNNAAAVLLALTSLAAGRAVLVSRGELVEIGGGFRVPEVLERSGARMVEVGTTNRTRLADYERALDEHPDVAVILSVHPGNFRITGFTEQPSLTELAKLAEARGKWLVDDLGGGALLDLEAFAGLEGEPVVADRVRAGAHAVCFSCDKVLGGPQGGAIVGRAPLIARVRRDPLARALRLGPMPTAALEATLDHYLAGDLDAVPVLAMMRRPRDEVRARVERWRDALAERGRLAEVVACEGRVGGGTFAEEPVPSFALHVMCDGITADELARRLRTGDVAVLPRIAEGRVLIDGRTVLDGEDEPLLAALLTVTSEVTTP
jgi:L-seryl-tRNA(Ser) seleniumtransferase